MTPWILRTSLKGLQVLYHGEKRVAVLHGKKLAETIAMILVDLDVARAIQKQGQRGDLLFEENERLRGKYEEVLTCLSDEVKAHQEKAEENERLRGTVKYLETEVEALNDPPAQAKIDAALAVTGKSIIYAENCPSCADLIDRLKRADKALRPATLAPEKEPK